MVKNKNKDLPEGKPILSLDFDGVFHSYSSGWQGADIIPDPPVEGAITFLFKASDIFDLQIFSSRSHQSGGREAMRAWLIKHITEHLKNVVKHPECEAVAISFVDKYISFPEFKPPAFLSIDDRGYCFTGIFPEPSTLLDFKPWNRKDSIEYEEITEKPIEFRDK